MLCQLSEVGWSGVLLAQNVLSRLDTQPRGLGGITGPLNAVRLLQRGLLSPRSVTSLCLLVLGYC